MVSDTNAELRELYEQALERCQQLRAEWESLDSELIVRGSRGQPVAHPLIRAMQDAERHAAQLAKLLAAPARAGREPAAISAIAPWITSEHRCRNVPHTPVAKLYLSDKWKAALNGLSNGVPRA